MQLGCLSTSHYVSTSADGSWFPLTYIFELFKQFQGIDVFKICPLKQAGSGFHVLGVQPLPAYTDSRIKLRIYIVSAELCL